MNYKHIVFDMDGTLIDTAYAITHALRDTYKHFKKEDIALEDLAFSFGIPGFVTLSQLEIEEKNEAMKFWEYHIQNTYADKITVFEGICKTIDTLYHKGYKLGIVTSKRATEIIHDFNHFGLSHYFELIISADDTLKHKPHPDPLLEYLKRSGASIEETLYIGDSSYDMLCAKGAGVDFALAVWGSIDPDMEAKYYPNKPEEICELVK